MNYIRSLFLNFLVVFFIDRVMPGVQVVNYEQVPNVGADILFALAVGFLNASVYPFLAILEISVTKLKLALFNFIISFVAFIAIALVPFGVHATFGVVLLGGTLAWIVAFFTNYLEWQHDLNRK
jgi:uncharacterized membrane protein YvlD (DUF360 family)